MTISETRLGAIGTGLTLGLSLVVLYLTLTPAVDLPLDDGRDKLWHVAGFAALVLPVAATRPGSPWLAVVLAACLGGAIELIQPHVGRHGEWGDALANLVGAVLGGLAGQLAWPVVRAVVLRTR